MYTPDAFQQNDFSRITQLMAECPLATLVVATKSGTEACHVPLYWEDDGSPYGVLYGHVAKNNPIHTLKALNNQWLVVFQDAGHYISPNGYPSKWIDHKAVPTWNYRSMHCTVEPTLITSPDALAQIVGKLSDIAEQGQPQPWSLTDAPTDYLAGMYQAIVGFRLRIVDVQAQFKLSQNKSPEDKQGVVKHLQQLQTDAASRMAHLIETASPPTPKPTIPANTQTNTQTIQSNPMNFHPLTIKTTTSRIDGKAKTVTFDVPDALISAYAWQAGQHITLSVPIDGQTVRRSYTISASPDTDEPLQITVKRVEGGLVSNTINQYWREGQVISIAPPSGDFVLTPQANAQRSHYFFGAGSGITPLWAMINSVLVAEPHSTCYLLYANRDDSTIIYRDELAELQEAYPQQLVVAHVLSSPRWLSGFKYWQSGRLDNAKIAQFIRENPPYAQDSQYYICAPNALLILIREALKNIDVPDNRVHFETFGGESTNPSSNQAIEGVYADLSVNLYGQTHELNVQENETVLEAMLNAGIHNAPYSCQSGVCGSCKAQLTNGKVAMKNRSALSDEDIKNGEILTCQAVCQSEQLAISFE